MHTYRSRCQAENALRDAGLSALPVKFEVVAGRVIPTIVCHMLKDYEQVVDRGFDAVMAEDLH